MTPVQTAAVPFAVAGVCAQHRAAGGSADAERATILRGRRAPRCALGLVADGLDGSSGGEPLGDRVVATAQRLFDDYLAGGPVDRLFEDLVTEVHVVLQEAGGPAAVHPRATLAALLVQPNRVDWCHVGDTRVYHARDGRLVRRTVDDTFGERVMRERRIDPGRTPMRTGVGVLTQALGGSRAPHPNVGGLRDPRPGDAFLLCTDGAWTPLTDSEIAELTAAPSPRDAVADLLARTADRAGGDDDRSVVLIRLVAAPPG